MQLSQAGTDTDGHLHAHTLTGDLVLTRSHARAHTRTPPKKKFLACQVEKVLLVLIKNLGVNSQSKLKG